MADVDIAVILSWIVGIVGVAYGVYAKYTGGDIKAGEVDSITQKAREAVMAAEQLYSTGKIPVTADGKTDARFVWVLDKMKTWFPTLTNEQFTVSIEAAVFWVKQVVLASVPVESKQEPIGTLTVGDSSLLIKGPDLDVIDVGGGK